MKYQGDPRQMPARFDSSCHTCFQAIKKNEQIIYWPNGKVAGHLKCDETDYLKCVSAMQQEDYGF